MPDRLRAALGLVFAAFAALLLTGCANCKLGAPGVPPRDAAEALQRINDNLSQVQGALQAKATVSFRFRDDSGARRQFLFHPGVIVFEAPRCLAFEIRSALGPVLARIGSDDERYWTYVDTDDRRKLWWGSWEALERGRAKPLLVPPDGLLDALMMGPLTIDPPPGPDLQLDLTQKNPRLLLISHDAHGEPYVRRELRLDRCPPYMPIEITDRSARGTVVMQAELGQYRGLTGMTDRAPFLPHKYDLRWWRDKTPSELRVDLQSIAYRESEVPFCRFPSAWRGEIEVLDDPNVPAVGDPDAGASFGAPLDDAEVSAHDLPQESF